MVELDSGRRKTQGGGGSSGLVSIESSRHFRVSLADLIPACGYDHRTRTATTKRMVLPTRTTLITNKVDAYNSACCVSVARARIHYETTQYAGWVDWVWELSDSPRIRQWIG